MKVGKEYKQNIFFQAGILILKLLIIKTKN